MKYVVCFFWSLFILISSPVIADECMEGDCEDGIGVGFTDEGKIYQGQWQDGLPHGEGRIQVSKGKYIEGVWDKGKLKEKTAN